MSVSSLAVRSRHRLAATALVGGSLLLTAAKPVTPAARPVTPRATGVTFKYRLSSANDGKKTTLANVSMQDGNIRMDYVEGTTPMGSKNGYVLVQGETGKFIIVNPKEKQAIMMTADGFGSGLGALMNNPMLKMTMSNMSFRFKDMGAGEPLLGYKTRKVRSYYSSTMEVKAMMMPDQKIISNDSTDQWIATGIDVGSPKNMEAWARSFASGVKSTNPELAAEMKKYTNEYGRTGMALKTVTWSSQTDKKGKVTTDVLTMEVTELKKGELDAALFTVPSGYDVVDMSQMMAGLSDKMDSLNAEAAKNGEKKEEKKPSAKDQLKSGLGGFLKKKPPV